MSSKSPATEIVTIELASDRSHLFGYAPSDGRKVLITTIVFPLGLIALSLLTGQHFRFVPIVLFFICWRTQSLRPEVSPGTAQTATGSKWYPDRSSAGKLFGNINGAMYKRLRRTGDEAFNVWNSILKTIQNHSTSMKASCS